MTSIDITIRNNERADELTDQLQSVIRGHYFECNSEEYQLFHDKSPHPIQKFYTFTEAQAFIEGVWFGKTERDKNM